MCSDSILEKLDLSFGKSYNWVGIFDRRSLSSKARRLFQTRTFMMTKWSIAFVGVFLLLCMLKVEVCRADHHLERLVWIRLYPRRNRLAAALLVVDLATVFRLDHSVVFLIYPQLLKVWGCCYSLLYFLPMHHSHKTDRAHLHQ
jgi:hypothetical protein